MRIFLGIFILGLLALPSLAQVTGDRQPLSAAPSDAQMQSSLDDLFSKLKRERNEAAAQRIAAQIWQDWTDSGSDTANLLMQRADAAMKAKKYNVALDLLDQVVVLFPDFAEGFNRRATVHFMMQDFSKSMTDIARTLELEPRHFGALSGMAGILEATGRKKEALEAYQQVLAIYPMMRSAQAEVAKLSDDLAGEGI